MLEKQQEICQLLLERVEYDLEQQQIVALIPQPEFLLLFRRLAGLRETEFRRFEPVVATGAGLGELGGKSGRLELSD